MGYNSCLVIIFTGYCHSITRTILGHLNLHFSHEPMFALSSSPLTIRKTSFIIHESNFYSPTSKLTSPQTTQNKQSEEGWSGSRMVLPLPQEQKSIHTAPLPVSFCFAHHMYLKTKTMTFYTAWDLCHGGLR